MTRPDLSNAAIHDANLARKREERRRAVALNEPLRRPEPTDAIKKLLDSVEAAGAALAKAVKVLADEKATPQQRKDAKAARKKALADIRRDRDASDALWTAQTDEHWINTALAETARLEQERGGDVSAPVIGPMRIKSRDGLVSLLEAGRLGGPDEPKKTQARFDAGIAYRELVEARTGDLGSQLGASEGRAGHDNDRFVWARQTRAKKMQVLGEIERAVAVECRDEPAGLQMLRWVAGQGHAISSFGQGGRAMARNTAALVRALDVADRFLQAG